MDQRRRKKTLSSLKFTAEDVKNMSIEELVFTVMLDRYDTMRTLAESHSLTIQRKLNIF